MGFWHYAAKGVRTTGVDMMKVMFDAQENGKDISDDLYLRMDAGKITGQHPEYTFPGHAAWLDWPWKLHRIEREGGIRFELYSIAADSMETTNLADQHRKRVQFMRDELEQWQLSVIRSLNGEDYEK